MIHNINQLLMELVELHCINVALNYRCQFQFNIHDLPINSAAAHPECTV